MYQRPVLVCKCLHWDLYKATHCHLSGPNRYAVPNATGKEVAIFDFYPDTGTMNTILVTPCTLLNSLSSDQRRGKEHLFKDRDGCASQSYVQCVYGEINS